MPVTGDDENLDGIAQATTSETDLCNDALGQIGANPISSLDDGTINARRCMIFYPQLRDSLLRAYKWKFALVRVQLPQRPTPPVFEFAYAYALPGDCLRIWEYNGALVSITGTPLVDVHLYPRYEPMYKIEGRTLVSNDGQAYVLYSRRVVNPAEWDALFYQTMSTWLAGKLAAAIAKDTRKAGELINLASTTLLSSALAANGQEQSNEPLIQDYLIWRWM